MKKIYIAGKITGLPIEEVKQNFERAKWKVEEPGDAVAICPLDLTHDHDKSWSNYMREDITAMLRCDGVFAMSNWNASPGATIEVELAEKLGLPVEYELLKLHTDVIIPFNNITKSAIGKIIGYSECKTNYHVFVYNACERIVPFKSVIPKL